MQHSHMKKATSRQTSNLAKIWLHKRQSLEVANFHIHLLRLTELLQAIPSQLEASFFIVSAHAGLY